MLQPQQEAFVHSEQAGTRRRAPVVTDRGRPFPAGRSRSGLSVEAGTLGRIYWFIGMWQQESRGREHCCGVSCRKVNTLNSHNLPEIPQFACRKSDPPITGRSLTC